MSIWRRTARTQAATAHEIDLRLTRDKVRGRLGSREFDLSLLGDDYRGSVRINGQRMPFVLRGAQQLWAMPAAAQGSILPLLLTCTEPTKVIQMVDLRQSDTLPPSPPRWLALPATVPSSSPAAPVLPHVSAPSQSRSGAPTQGKIELARRS